jgi:UDP-N-acetylglucosamine 2-epimerase (hydrolysing)
MLLQRDETIQDWGRFNEKISGDKAVDSSVDNTERQNEEEDTAAAFVLARFCKGLNLQLPTWLLRNAGRRRRVSKKGNLGHGRSHLSIKRKNDKVEISVNVEQHVDSDNDTMVPQPCQISQKRRRIAFSSNTRADWVKLQPLADILVDNGFDVDIFVTGMHMIKEYGSTFKDIVKNRKFGVFTRNTWTPGDSEIQNATATMEATFQLLQESDYDLLIVHGDRLDAKAAADAAHLFRCRLGHVEGGDLTGGDDNKNRYAITAIADYHFPSSQDAADRLISCGQKIETIFPIGSPDLDVFLRPSTVSIEYVLRKYSIPFKDFGIAPFHPNSAESETSGEQAMNFYSTLLASGRNFIVPRPNNDKGTERVQEVLDALPKNRVCVVPNFEFNDYVILLKQAGCVAGNSSVVVTSAPAIGKPCLNIGTRQQGRTPPTDGLFNFSPNDRQGILGCLRENWGRTYPRNSHYGDGCAAERFLEALSSRSFWELSQQKLLFNQKAF